MESIWEPSAWGLRWSRQPAWQLRREGQCLLLQRGGQRLRLPIDPNFAATIDAGAAELLDVPGIAEFFTQLKI